MNRIATSEPHDSRAVHLRATGPYRLPVSQQAICLKPCAGHEDLMLLEAPALDLTLALELLQSVAIGADGDALDWPSCAGTDIDAALLLVRRSVFGDRVSADIACPRSGCGTRIEVDFGIEEYLAHHAPRASRAFELTAGDGPGWYGLGQQPIQFRIPTGGDIVAAATERDAERALIHRCVRPAGLDARSVRRVLRIIEAMAPSLSGELQGQCAECGAQVSVYFDARGFALRELLEQATFLYEDTCLLAQHYHWREADILALPCSRRIHYVEALKQQRGAA